MSVSDVAVPMASLPSAPPGRLRRPAERLFVLSRPAADLPRAESTAGGGNASPAPPEVICCGCCGMSVASGA